MDLQPWVLLAIAVAFALGWFAARVDLRALLAESRSLPRSYFKGLNFLLSEQPDRAVDAFIEVVQLDPETIELHFALGSLFRRRGETERAIRMHQNLLNRPDLPDDERLHAMFELGIDYLKAGLLDRAEESFRKLEDTTFGVDARRHLLEIFEIEKEWRQAIGVAEALQTAGHRIDAGPHRAVPLRDRADRDQRVAARRREGRARRRARGESPERARADAAGRHRGRRASRRAGDRVLEEGRAAERAVRRAGRRQADRRVHAARPRGGRAAAAALVARCHAVGRPARDGRARDADDRGQRGRERGRAARAASRADACSRSRSSSRRAVSSTCRPPRTASTSTSSRLCCSSTRDASAATSARTAASRRATSTGSVPAARTGRRIRRAAPKNSNRTEAERGSQSMKVTIVGSGYVGLVTGACLAEVGNHVVCLDVDAQKIEILERRRHPDPRAGPARDGQAQPRGRPHRVHDRRREGRRARRGAVHRGRHAARRGRLGRPAVRDRRGAQHRPPHDGFKVVVDKSTVPVGTADKVRAAVADELAKRGVGARLHGRCRIPSS